MSFESSGEEKPLLEKSSEAREEKRRRWRKSLKTEIVAVRLVPGFKRILEQLAQNEGLDVSAWMRNLILKELKARGIISETAPTAATFEEALLGSGKKKS